MQFPIYDSHFYVGFPVFLWLSINLFNKYKRSRNISSLYISVAVFFLSISMFSWGFPALFTDNSSILSAFTFMGDISQGITFLSLWLLSIRAFLSHKPKLQLIAKILVFSLFIISITDSAHLLLTSPFTTYVEQLSKNTMDIVFVINTRYDVLTGINSISFFLLSYYLWTTSRSAQTSSQKLRIRSLSVALFLATLLYIGLQALPIPNIYAYYSAANSVMFLIIPISTIVSHFLSKTGNGQVNQIDSQLHS